MIPPNGIGFRCEAFRDTVVTIGEQDAVVTEVSGPDDFVVEDPAWPGPLHISVI